MSKVESLKASVKICMFDQYGTVVDMPAALARLQAVTRYAYAKAPFYRRKWDEAGFHPDHLRSLEDFEDKVPVITKADLRESQSGRGN